MVRGQKGRMKHDETRGTGRISLCKEDGIVIVQDPPLRDKGASAHTNGMTVCNSVPWGTESVLS